MIITKYNYKTSDIEKAALDTLSKEIKKTLMNGGVSRITVIFNEDQSLQFEGEESEVRKSESLIQGLQS